MNLSLLSVQPNSSIYASVIESVNCPRLGSQLHAHTLKTGFYDHNFVQTKLLQMYTKQENIPYSRLLFNKMAQRNVYSWAALLTLYANLGYFNETASLFERMLKIGDVPMEFFIFPPVLKSCTSSNVSELEYGRQVHGFVVKSGFSRNVYVGNGLIDMYGKSGSLDEGKQVFYKMDEDERDIVSWNSVITGCVSNGLVVEALGFLEKMNASGSVGMRPNHVSWSAVIGGLAQNGNDEEVIEMLYRMQECGVEPNAQTLASVLPACARLQCLGIGKEIHGFIARHEFMSNAFVVNRLVDVYRRCGDMISAMKVFSKFSLKNVVSFNTIIVGYFENGEVDKAKKIFDQMDNLSVKKDIISWNSMISGYVDNRLCDEALNIFRDLQFEEAVESTSYTLGSALAACAGLAALRRGKEIHAYAIIRGLHLNSFVCGSLVELYCRCLDIVSARMVFDQVNEHETATWNALISGYSRTNKMEVVDELLLKMEFQGEQPNIYTWNGIIAGNAENRNHELALQNFCRLQLLYLKPDIYTTGIAISVCSNLSTIERGKQVHGYSIKCGYDTDVHVGSSLVDMYSKCGNVRFARLAFRRISKLNLVSWNSMLGVFAIHGPGKDGIALFRQMQVKGIQPDGITFLSILSSCVHEGMVELGLKYFTMMKHYNLEPTLKHYTCVVDLLSRSSRLNEAYELIKNMKFDPDVVIWGALLGGCVMHGNVILGEIAAKKVIELEPNNTGNYVMLANLYASVGRWDDHTKTRQIIKNQEMHKIPGCSWIEDRDQFHLFVASDRSHKQFENICAVMNTLTIQMRKAGSTLDTS